MTTAEELKQAEKAIELLKLAVKERDSDINELQTRIETFKYESERYRIVAGELLQVQAKLTASYEEHEALIEQLKHSEERAKHFEAKMQGITENKNTEGSLKTRIENLLEAGKTNAEELEKEEAKTQDALARVELLESIIDAAKTVLQIR